MEAEGPSERVPAGEPTGEVEVTVRAAVTDRTGGPRLAVDRRADPTVAAEAVPRAPAGRAPLGRTAPLRELALKEARASAAPHRVAAVLEGLSSREKAGERARREGGPTEGAGDLDLEELSPADGRPVPTEDVQVELGLSAIKERELVVHRAAEATTPARRASVVLEGVRLALLMARPLPLLLAKAAREVAPLRAARARGEVGPASGVRLASREAEMTLPRSEWEDGEGDADVPLKVSATRSTARLVRPLGAPLALAVQLGAPWLGALGAE